MSGVVCRKGKVLRYANVGDSVMRELRASINAMQGTSVGRYLTYMYLPTLV